MTLRGTPTHAFSRGARHTATIAAIGSTPSASCSPRSSGRRVALSGRARDLYRILAEIVDGFVAAGGDVPSAEYASYASSPPGDRVMWQESAELFFD
jgi:hypothetical protein